jgi:hypothetical protein
MAREASLPPKSQMDKLVKLVKSDPDGSERFYSESTGIPMNMIGRALYVAEVTADPSLKISPTPAAVTKAVNAGGLRWPRIATYAGISVGQAKQLYETHTGKTAPSNITSRGRQFENGASATPAKRGPGRPRGTKAAETAKGTSGRRGRAAAKTTEKPKEPTNGRRGRRGTRASANPK